MNVKPEDLHEYVLELLPRDEHERLTRLIQRDAKLAAEVALLRETLGLFGSSAPTTNAPTPSASGRARLLSALDGGARFSPFVADLARCFDLTEAAVRALCDRIDDAGPWEPSRARGIELFHFECGPNALAQDTGFVRFAPGVRFPYHRHLGYEISYVIEGAMLDGDGTLYVPGESITMPPGSAHEYSIPDSGAVIAVVQAGFELVDKPT